jgi:putative oxidoreductase
MLRDGLIRKTSMTSQTRSVSSSGKSLDVFLRHLDERMLQVVASHSTSLIRISLATIFIWFGLLKIIGFSPVSDLVAQTIHWMPAPPDLLVILLGILETALGLGLLFGRGAVLRVTVIIFLLHLSGTLLVLAQPDIAFQKGNPLLLTTEGEFVIKNLVMIAAGLVLLGRARSAESDV